ncbi:hypothetical protein B0H13DRAFT_2311652 [Mycena leptocephala]|nr:hypothetical protein B0H13DRAFT_2311652 [Mycena leptocephala]
MFTSTFTPLHMSLTNASNPIIHPDTTIIDILSGPHVDGYRISAILCPPATTSPTAPTDWASSTPSLDEWIARDESARSTIELNIVDIVELGLDDLSISKALWDSITTKYRNKSTMAVAYAKDMMAKEIFAAGGDISDDEHMTNLIGSLPESLDHIKPTLYTLTSSTINDIFNIKSPDLDLSPINLSPLTAAARNSLVHCAYSGYFSMAI